MHLESDVRNRFPLEGDRLELPVPRAIEVRFRHFTLRLADGHRRQRRIIDGAVQPKPAILLLSRACISRGTGSSNPPPSSSESANHRYRSASRLRKAQVPGPPTVRPSVSSALNQHVQNLALVIHGTPQIHPLARDAHHHLLQCQRLLGRGRRWRSRRAIARPNLSTHRRTVS
jgi:hypothetical protein